VRPLLAFSQEEIEEYAKFTIQWREDSSNASDKYLRNNSPSFGSDVKGIEFKFSFRHFIKRKRICKKQVMVEDASIMIYQQVAKQGRHNLF
jgi:tRNA(Ile)-lysidine synthase